MKITTLYQNQDSNSIDYIGWGLDALDFSDFIDVLLLGVERVFGDADGHVNVVFVSRDDIKQLNKKYRKKDSVTDVLSFETVSEFDSLLLGEVYICLDVIVKANLDKVLCSSDLAAVIVHGILHLLGYTHTGGMKKGGQTAQVEDMFIKQGKLVDEVARIVINK